MFTAGLFTAELFTAELFIAELVATELFAVGSPILSDNFRISFFFGGNFDSISFSTVLYFVTYSKQYYYN